MHGDSCRGSLFAENGVKTEFTCKSSNGKQRSAVIDGHAYDLAKGSLFVVSEDGDNFRVKQLKRDLSNLVFNRENLQKFARSDKEIKEFFGREWNQPK